MIIHGSTHKPGNRKPQPCGQRRSKEKTPAARSIAGETQEETQSIDVDKEEDSLFD